MVLGMAVLGENVRSYLEIKMDWLFGNIVRIMKPVLCYEI